MSEAFNGEKSQEARLREIIAKAESLDRPTPVAEDLLRNYVELKSLGQKLDNLSPEQKEVMGLMREKLKDSTLIDLGCGREGSISFMYELAAFYGAKAYIGVDKYLPDNFEEKLKKGGIGDIKKEYVSPPSFNVIKQDMLEFLSDRTEQSNFAFNGIDEYIFNDNSEANREYLRELFKNIARLTPDNGIIFGVGSDFLSRLKECNFKRFLLDKKDIGDIEIWQKTKEKE